MTSTKQAFDASPLLSVKLSNYFEIYDELLTPFVGRDDLVLVECGVLHGGSLHMWRSLLGPRARIVGVDLHPGAMKHRADGFEIFIADQEDDVAMRHVFEQIGECDLVIDDGAHTNAACLNTLWAAMPHIRAGGLHIVEDTHTSFDKSFGNPGRTSAFEFGVALASHLTCAYASDSPNTEQAAALGEFRTRVASVQFFPSMMVLRYRAESVPWSKPVHVANDALEMDDIVDMRNSRTAASRFQARGLALWAKLPARTQEPVHRGVTAPGRLLRDALLRWSAIRRNHRLERELRRRGRRHW